MSTAAAVADVAAVAVVEAAVDVAVEFRAPAVEFRVPAVVVHGPPTAAAAVPCDLQHRSIAPPALAIPAGCRSAAADSAAAAVVWAHVTAPALSPIQYTRQEQGPASAQAKVSIPGSASGPA